MDYTSIILNQLQEAWDNSFAKQYTSMPNPVKILGQSVISSPLDGSSVTTIMLTQSHEDYEVEVFLKSTFPEILVNLYTQDKSLRSWPQQKFHTETISENNRFTTYNTYLQEEIAFQVNWVETDIHHIITIINPNL